MSREITYEPDLVCESCGKRGAFDFMGDALCSKCSAPNGVLFEALRGILDDAEAPGVPLPTPTPAPTEDARWLSPEQRESMTAGYGIHSQGGYHTALMLKRHAQLMDERLQQTWLAFTVERDLHNAAKKEIAAKDREIAELRRDRERLGWLSDRKTIMVQTIRVSECAGDVKELLADRCDQQRKTLREAIDAAMKETNAV